MKRVDMVRQGTQKLIEAENSIEKALRDVAGLTCDLSDMRLNSNLSVMYGQSAFIELSGAMTMLTDARGKIVEVHKALNEIKTGIGCANVRMDGVIYDKPQASAQGQAVVNFRDVA